MNLLAEFAIKGHSYWGTFF